MIKNGAVKKFNEKPIQSETWINGGFFVLNKKVIKFIINDKSIWEREPLQNIAKKNQLIAYKHKSYWAAMDTLREKNILNNLWRSGEAPWKIWK